MVILGEVEVAAEQPPPKREARGARGAGDGEPGLVGVFLAGGDTGVPNGEPEKELELLCDERGRGTAVDSELGAEAEAAAAWKGELRTRGDIPVGRPVDCACFVGEVDGVVKAGRSGEAVDTAGDSGRRKGELRAAVLVVEEAPKPSGEGLKGLVMVEEKEKRGKERKGKKKKGKEKRG